MINIVELDERINKCLSILQENPRSHIFAALAEVYRRRGDVGRAFSVCKNGLRIHPDYGAAHVVMAKLYLHQNMVEQGRTSIERAIELDGPSRSTDLVLAEMLLEAGDLAGTREILNRLGQVGSQDPAIEGLRQRLRDTVRGKEPTHRPKYAPSTLPAEPGSSEAPPANEAAVPRREKWCASPEEAVDEIAHIPQAAGCALWDDDGTNLASRARLDQDPQPVVDETWALYVEIKQRVHASGWGRLSAIRIEEAKGQWGMLSEEGMVALIWGTARVGYAAAVRRMAECMRQLSSRKAPEDTDKPARPSMAESSPE